MSRVVAEERTAIPHYPLDLLRTHLCCLYCLSSSFKAGFIYSVCSVFSFSRRTTHMPLLTVSLCKPPVSSLRNCGLGYNGSMFSLWVTPSTKVRDYPIIPKINGRKKRGRQPRFLYCLSLSSPFRIACQFCCVIALIVTF